MKNGFFSLLILSLCFAAHAIDLENVSPEKHHELETLFQKSAFSAKDSASLQSKDWTCEMYGVRTRLQVKHNVKLYKWDKWHNAGAQPVSDYKPGATELVGENSRLEDRIRVTEKGQIISQLSVVSPERHVVAYSLCSTP